MTRKPKAVPFEEICLNAVKDKATDLEVAAVSEGVSQPSESLIATTLETIPINITLPCTLYYKQNGKLFVFRRQGEKINYKTALGMQKSGTNTLYIHQAFWRMFTEALEKLKITADPAHPENYALHLRHLLYAYGNELEKRIRAPKRPMLLKLRETAEGMAESIKKDPAVGLKLLRPATDPNIYFVNHSVNTAIYAALMGAKFRLKLADLKLLTFAVFVHDIGNVFVPRRLLYKPMELTEDEMEIVKGHSRKGAELLQEQSMPGVVVQVADQHHEHIDGTGYPSNIKAKDIHFYSKICSVVDVFDALISERPHQKAKSKEEAISILRSCNGRIEPKLVDLLESILKEMA